MAVPFPIAADQVALELEKSIISTPTFRNATGNGRDAWKSLTYPDLAQAQQRGVYLQPAFASVNTDDPSLGGFQKRNGKMILYHGMADQVIPVLGSNHYYVEAAKKHNGYSSLQRFFRYFPVPGMGHCYGVGSVSGLSGVSPSADSPLLDNTQMFNALVDWVENGHPPDHLTIVNASKTLSRPLCAYPKKLKYLGHDMNTVKGYICE